MNIEFLHCELGSDFFKEGPGLVVLHGVFHIEKQQLILSFEFAFSLVQSLGYGWIIQWYELQLYITVLRNFAFSFTNSGIKLTQDDGNNKIILFIQTPKLENQLICITLNISLGIRELRMQRFYLIFSDILHVTHSL